MSASKSKKSVFLFISICFIVGMQGCDKISEFTDYLSSKIDSAKTSKQESAISSPASRDAGFPGKPGKQKLPKNVLAQVGEWTLTIEEFRSRLTGLQDVLPDYDINNIEQNKLILDELLSQQLLVQDAENSGLAQKKEILRAMEEFRSTLLVREIATRITTDITATNEEAREYYTQNPQEFTPPVQWRVRELVVNTDSEAKMVLVTLYQGADFAQMVTQKSKGKSAQKQGDLGYLSQFAFVKMGNIVSALDIGGISGVFKGPEGFYIVKLENKKEGVLKKFEELKEEIKRGLTFLKQQQAILTHLDALRQKTRITVNEELLK